MTPVGWALFSATVLVKAFGSAAYHRRQGYPFIRTFIMAVLGFAGLGLLLFKMFNGG